MNSAQFSSIMVSAILVQNLVIIYMLCDKNLFKALAAPSTAAVFGCCVTFWTTFASMLAWLADSFILKPYSIEWLSPVVFIIIIAALEIAAEAVISRIFPQKEKLAHRFLTGSAFGSAVFGLVLLNVEVNMRGFFGAAFYGLCAGIGYLAALFIIYSALGRLKFSSPPTVFKGIPIALVTTGIISLAFMGFSNISISYW